MTYVVSNIHGKMDRYNDLLNAIGFGEKDVLYVLGDVVDYGEDPMGVLCDMSMRPNVHKMAKKVQGYIKLQIPAGKATPAPPVGPALGQHGVNIVEFTKQFNARTADQDGMIIPVVITVYNDRSFSFITKTPPAAVLISIDIPNLIF